MKKVFGLLFLILILPTFDCLSCEDQSGEGSIPQELIDSSQMLVLSTDEAFASLLSTMAIDGEVLEYIITTPELDKTEQGLPFNKINAAIALLDLKSLIELCLKVNMFGKTVLNQNYTVCCDMILKLIEPRILSMEIGAASGKLIPEIQDIDTLNYLEKIFNQMKRNKEANNENTLYVSGILIKLFALKSKLGIEERQPDVTQPGLADEDALDSVVLSSSTTDGLPDETQMGAVLELIEYEESMLVPVEMKAPEIVAVVGSQVESVEPSDLFKEFMESEFCQYAHCLPFLMNDDFLVEGGHHNLQEIIQALDSYSVVRLIKLEYLLNKFMKKEELKDTYKKIARHLLDTIQLKKIKTIIEEDIQAFKDISDNDLVDYVLRQLVTYSSFKASSFTNDRATLNLIQEISCEVNPDGSEIKKRLQSDIIKALLQCQFGHKPQAPKKLELNIDEDYKKKSKRKKWQTVETVNLVRAHPQQPDTKAEVVDPNQAFENFATSRFVIVDNGIPELSQVLEKLSRVELIQLAFVLKEFAAKDELKTQYKDLADKVLDAIGQIKNTKALEQQDFELIASEQRQDLFDYVIKELIVEPAFMDVIPVLAKDKAKLSRIVELVQDIEPQNDSIKKLLKTLRQVILSGVIAGRAISISKDVKPVKITVKPRENYPLDAETLSQRLSAPKTSARDEGVPEALLNSVVLVDTIKTRAQESDDIEKRHKKAKDQLDKLKRELEATQKAHERMGDLSLDTEIAQICEVQTAVSQADEVLQQQLQERQRLMQEANTMVREALTSRAEVQATLDTAKKILLDKLDDIDEKRQFIDREEPREIEENTKAKEALALAQQRVEASDNRLALLQQHREEINRRFATLNQGKKVVAKINIAKGLAGGAFSPKKADEATK